MSAAASAMCVTDRGQRSASAAAHAVMRTLDYAAMQTYASTIYSIMVSTLIIYGLLLTHRPEEMKG